MAKKLEASDLQQFTGSDNFYKSSIFSKRIVHSDGVQYVAEVGRAFWLIDAIVSYLTTATGRRTIARDPRLGQIQFWRLDVVDNKAILTCRADADEAPAITQRIEYTDFPLEKIEIWAQNDGQRWTLHLPSEY